MASSFTASPRSFDQELDENDSFDYDDDKDLYDQMTDEDTEDASETDMVKREEEYTEIKEQMYQDKLAQLKKQLQQLKEGTLPEYMKRLKKIDQQYKERLRMADIWRDYEITMVENDYLCEKRYSAKEFEEKKIDLKENLIIELEEKKKNMEADRAALELTGDPMEVKPVMTRKLRRRPNDPMPMPEKRRKQSPTQLNYELDDHEIMEDLRIISKISGKPLNRKPHIPPLSGIDTPNYDARIEDGRLYYEKRWFHRGQPVYIEGKDIGKVNAVISAVGTQDVWVRKLHDNSKIKISVAQLQKGRYTLRRRST
ncbi:unnamed protein product [Owenia fusiformis]|uniref:Uncharacterized protein n=1 Tax=Owenia fusiformis TaxID=6347 RepID=A0A8J1TKN3_OWEFU|nr:unnamed protein product [Owenia fusiformis]